MLIGQFKFPARQPYAVGPNIGVSVKYGPDCGRWRIAERKMRMENFGWQISLGKEINYNHDGSKLYSGRSLLLGACNSHNKSMQRHFYRPVYF